jgi:hypothetical protein
MRWVALTLAVYVVGWLFTFGWLYNRPRECPYHNAGMCDFDRDAGAFFGATLWPAYWPTQFAIQVTKP